MRGGRQARDGFGAQFTVFRDRFHLPDSLSIALANRLIQFYPDPHASFTDLGDAYEAYCPSPI